jgi:drug/metabolite transporter (DMT)-like permease
VSSALIAIVLWSSLASLVAQLTRIPPFLLTGIGLCMGGLYLLPKWRSWQVPLKTFLIGSAALFFYHAALFSALKLAPVVSANLINYLWPLLIVVLAPLFDRQQKLTGLTLLAALLGFTGAALAIVGEQGLHFDQNALQGYFLALIAALIWSSYTLLLRRLPAFPSTAVGGFNLAAGGLSLITASMVETLPVITRSDIALIVLIGLGPLGYAFYCWDKAAKQLASKTIGVLSFMTPVISTALLVVSRSEPLKLQIWIAALLVLLATAIVLLKPNKLST